MFIRFIFDHIFVVPLFFIALPLALWKRSWFIAYSVLFGLFFAAIWSITAYQMSRPDYVDHAAGAGFAYGLFLLLTFIFVAGVIVRLIVYGILGYFKNRKNNISEQDLME